MKQKLNDKENRIWVPYAVILLVVCVLEVFVCNISTWKTMGNEPIVLAEHVKTNEKGVYETGVTDVFRDVQNVDVSLNVVRYDRAEVTVSITDAGDQYAYELPVYEVVPDVKDSGYQNIYPFGTVHTINVKVSVPEGTEAEIESIMLNTVRPFSFKWIRVVILFALILTGYLMCTENGLMSQVCREKEKSQMIITACVVLCIVIVAALAVRSNPVCVNPIWPHHRQYQELAHSLMQGKVTMDEVPDPALLAKDNPYDTSALLVEDITFKMDYALYDGQYFAYFGIIPELLFYLPFYILTGGNLPNYAVVYILYLGVVLGVFGTVLQIIRRYAKNTPYIVYLVLSTVVCLTPHYVAMVARPDIYNVPVMAGNAFLWLGTFCWLKALADKKRNRLWYGLGALSMACIMGCRPQMILYAIAVFGILILPDIWKKRHVWSSKEIWQKYGKDVAAFCIPVALVGVVVFWYNYARFGSGFDFGATYSLTSNDMNNRGFNFSRILRGLYSFLFQPSVVNATFPFLESCELESNYMGKNIVEFSYGGIFLICPIMISLLYVWFGGWKKCSREVNRFVFGLSAASLIVASFDINAAGILQRYMCDMVFGFIVAAVIAVIVMMEQCRETDGYRWIVKGLYFCLVFAVVFGFMVVFTSADSTCLNNYDPVLFYEAASYFRF